MAQYEWALSQTYADRDFLSLIHCGNIHLELRDQRYTVLQYLCPVCRAKENHFYRVSYSASASALRWKCLYIWQDEAGEELSKGYLHSGDRIVSPECGCRLFVELLVCGKAGGTLEYSDLSVVEEGPYTERKVRICAAAYQMLEPDQIPREFAENVAHTLREVDAVAHLHPDVVVLTENVYQTGEDVSATGKNTTNHLNDIYVQKLCDKARQYRCYIVCSLEETDAEGILHNTGLLINRRGELQGIYRKTHLTIGEAELGMSFEDELPVFETDFGKIGILICWDHFFPEAVRELALKGMELCLVPTHGFRMERAATRAMENGVYFVTAHTLGSATAIFDPDGQAIDTGAEKGYAFAEVDLNRPVMVRWLSCDSYGDPHSYYLNERRPEIYHCR